MREYIVTMRDPKGGDTQTLGRVTARTMSHAYDEAHDRWPFVPVGWWHILPLSPDDEPRRRGFHDADVARRAGQLAHTPEAEAKRRVTRAHIAAWKQEHEKPLTVGQRKWRDLRRRRLRGRKRDSPRRSHDEG